MSEHPRLNAIRGRINNVYVYNNYVPRTQNVTDKY